MRDESRRGHVDERCKCSSVPTLYGEKIIIRIGPMVHDHHTITRNFGHDRRGSDRRRQRITLKIEREEWRDPARSRIDQRQTAGEPAMQRATHGRRSLLNIEEVDLLLCGNPYTDRTCPPDNISKTRALRLGDFLESSTPTKATRGQDHCRRDDRASQRAPPFIQTAIQR